MTETTVRGKFLWHTLLTADAKAAAEFYGKVIGWKTQTRPHDPDYTLLALPSGLLAGIRQFPPEAPATLTAQWVPYIGTPNLHGTIEQCRVLGGSVVKDVTLIPNTGEFAVLADPQGAEFAVYTPTNAADGDEAAAKLAEFSWHELATRDLTAAIDFYRQLFAWEEIAAHDMGPMGTYLIFGRNGKHLGGMFKTMGEDPVAPNWLSYVRVADVDKAVAKVTAAGGQVMNGPMEVPGGDWIAQCLDPQGGAFAVHALKKVAKTKPAAPVVVALAAAEDPAGDQTDDQEFTATLVMERVPSLMPPTKPKPKAQRKTQPATPPAPDKSPTVEKTAAKPVKKPAAKTKAAAPAAKKSKKATKPAGRPAAKKASKKVAKRAGKPAKVAPRKASRPAAKTKKAAKRKK